MKKKTDNEIKLLSKQRVEFVTRLINETNSAGRMMDEFKADLSNLREDIEEQRELPLGGWHLCGQCGSATTNTRDCDNCIIRLNKNEINDLNELIQSFLDTCTAFNYDSKTKKYTIEGKYIDYLDKRKWPEEKSKLFKETSK